LTVQLQRLASQRGLTDDVSEKIIASQAPMSVKILASHHVVWNDGSLDALIPQTDLFARYLHDRYG
jgi:dephospho-CoA kinase